VKERLAIVGSGAIACGLASTAAHHVDGGGRVILLARSAESAERAAKTVEKTLAKLEAQVDPQHVQIVTDSAALTEATFVVEAVIEHHDIKADLLAELSSLIGDDAILATTTSSLSVQRLAKASGQVDRFVGLHVFNPVTRMKLVELVFPQEATQETKDRATALCETFE
jgi:3-hydroxybutyryl-CoA dehydrogenase